MTTLLIGEKYRTALEKALIFKGFRVIWLPNNPYVDPRLSHHADLSAIVLENKKIVLSKHLAGEDKIVKYLTNRGYTIIYSKQEQVDKYPGDVNLCACRIGNKILHNSKFTDPEILKNTEAELIHVNQGYANCMILAIDDKRIITADNGIAKVAAESELEVLKIYPGSVTLDGFAEGFIGGAGFRVDGTIYFTGDIGKHPDAKEIIRFIESAGVEVCCLTEMELFDIGGAVIID